MSPILTRFDGDDAYGQLSLSAKFQMNPIDISRRKLTLNQNRWIEIVGVTSHISSLIFLKNTAQMTIKNDQVNTLTIRNISTNDTQSGIQQSRR